MLSKFSFSVISLLILSSPSLAVYRGIFSQTCYQYTSRGVVRHGAQGVCINDCAAIYLGGKPQRLTRGTARFQDGGCTGGINGHTPCNVGASAFGVQGTSCDEYPYATTHEGAASGNPAVLRCIPAGENSSGGQQLTQFYSSGVQPGDTFDVAFVWGQPVYNNMGQQVGTNPPIPAAAVQMCYAQHRANDGREFRMILTTQLFRRFTSVFRRETPELREVTAGHESAVVEPTWARTARNLTVMAYGDIKLETPVWSDLYGKDEVVRIIKSSDPDYPPKMSTKTTGSKTGGNQSTKGTGGKSTKMIGATPTAPARLLVTKAHTTGTKAIPKSTKTAANRREKA
ncbi:hypothetical protein EDD18DRAFT_790500 [Armillaria luteobubalina]|uniref:Deoxyribonuclease NucA/NucB domain-containing protein n=1 Tax=Armillaria luteobubalina TaxID=153913 RepID=A0AA39QG00_9AGAR|nr:hypothetical protein EDD18DRAFT_790500 [Armillaria luteobubalina]